MKKIILGLCFLFLTFPAFADSAPITEQEAKEVEAFFESYVNSANNYSEDLVNKYENNAVIKRVVIKPDGTKQTVTIPMERYIKELSKGKKLAKLVNYKNTYTNKRYEKTGDNKFKIKTIRTPFKDKRSLNAEFTVTKTQKGYKISEESLETNVQRFLTEK